MTVTAITLTDPASGVSVPILPRTGVSAQVVDATAPARAATEDRAGGRGAYDTTRYAAAGAVSLSMLLWPGDDGSGPEDFLDELAPLLDPALRPVLTVSNDRWDTDRQVTLRYDSIAKPLSDPTNWPVQVSWAAPDAVWEAATPVVAFVGAAIAADNTGMLFIPTIGSQFTAVGSLFTATTEPAPSEVSGGGAAASKWVGRLYGPCTGPKIANDTAALTIEFTDALNLGPGEYVDLGPEPWTAVRNSDPGDDVAGLLDFTTSRWWSMQTATNILRYYPTSAGAGSQAQLTFRPAWPL